MTIKLSIPKGGIWAGEMPLSPPRKPQEFLVAAGGSALRIKGDFWAWNNARFGEPFCLLFLF